MLWSLNIVVAISGATTARKSMYGGTLISGTALSGAKHISGKFSVRSYSLTGRM
jgi:hypothetical protein